MSRKILIVDDEAEICSVLRLFFQKQGYQVVTCTDGDGAIGLVSQERPQLVILDMKMPGISGVEVLRILREKRSAAKVIMLSAVKDDGVIQETLRLGADAYLTKPFRLDHMAQLVESVISGKKGAATPPALG